MNCSYILVAIGAAFLCICSMTKALSDSFKADVILQVKQFYFSGCLTLLHPSQLSDSDFSSTRILHQLAHVIFKNFIYYAVLHRHALNNTNRDDWCRKNKPIYVALSSNDDTKLHLQMLFSTSTVSNARWLLFLDNGTTVEDFFSGVNVPFDCEFLVAQRSSEEPVSLTEVYRVAEGLPLQMSYWGNWSVLHGLQGPADALYERRNDLQGVVIRAAAVNDPPLVMVTEAEDGKPLHADGLFPQLWFEVGTKINFSTELHGPEDGGFGNMRENGSWTGAIGMILAGKVTVSLNHFYMTPQRSNVIDYTRAILATRASVYIRTPDSAASKWSVFLEPFSGGLWLAMVGSILFLGCSLATLNAILHRVAPAGLLGYENYSLWESLLCVWGSFCGQGDWRTPTHLSCRVVHFICFVTALTTLMAYSATFVADLTVGKVALPFNDLEGLLEDGTYGFELRSKAGLFTNFQNSSNPVMRQVYVEKLRSNRKNLPRTIVGGFRKCCKEKITFMAGEEYWMSFADNVSCSLSALPHASITTAVVHIISKNFPYRGVINYNLMKMLRTGVVRRLFLTKWHRQLSEPEPMLRSVTLAGAAPILSLIVVGVVGCAAVLTIELVHRHLTRRTYTGKHV